MSESSREALSEVQEWSEHHSGCPGVVGRPSGNCGRGREAIPDIREWSGDPPGCPREVGRPSRMC